MNWGKKNLPPFLVPDFVKNLTNRGPGAMNQKYKVMNYIYITFLLTFKSKRDTIILKKERLIICTLK